MKVVIDRYAWLPKHELTITQLQSIRDSLLVVPNKVGDQGDEPKPIELWEETELHLGVPREFFEKHRKPHHEADYRYSKGSVVLNEPLKFVGALRDEQSEALNVFLSEFAQPEVTGGILRASPGWGKTVWTCALTAKLRVPTLVFLHKEFLMDQWRERIEQFLPEASVGLVQQDKCDFEGRDIVLAMVHSLAGREYPAALYEWPGLIVTDETHRIGAYTWSPVPAKFPARWRLGISATPRRKDRADDVFLYQIGPVRFKASEQRMKPKIKRVWSTFRLLKTERFNPSLAPRTLIIKFLVASATRNDRIVDQVLRAVQVGRKVLVLSERLQHLDRLTALFEKAWAAAEPDKPVPAVGFYVGGTKKAEREEAATASVIMATSQYAQEGLDIPALDTLVLATPMSDVEQAVGRILRPSKGKKDPIVVDIRDDNIPAFRKAAEARDRLYARIT